MIVVEPEKQLTLLFGMKAPGWDDCVLAWKIKATIVLSMSRFLASARYAGAVLLVIDDPRHLFIFRGMAKQIARLAEQSKINRQNLRYSFMFPIASWGKHGRMRTLFSQQQWIDMKVLVPAPPAA